MSYHTLYGLIMYAASLSTAMQELDLFCNAVVSVHPEHLAKLFSTCQRDGDVPQQKKEKVSRCFSLSEESVDHWNLEARLVERTSQQKYQKSFSKVLSMCFSTKKKSSDTANFRGDRPANPFALAGGTLRRFA